MHTFTATYMPWITFLVAISLWIGIGFVARTIYVQEMLRVKEAADFDKESILHSTALRTHALARDTKDGRAKLDQIARAGIVDILESIEQVGRDSGISLEIGQAIASPGTGLGSAVHSIGLIVKGEGSFERLVHAATLFESLSVPSFVDELQFEILPASISNKSVTSTWNLVVRIHFISTTEISS